FSGWLAPPDAKTSSTTRRTGTVAANRFIRSPYLRTRRLRENPRLGPEKFDYNRFRTGPLIIICWLWGHFRKSAVVFARSVVPPGTDIVGAGRHVAKVPI